MTNILDSKLDTVKERINEVEYRSIKVTQMKHKEIKRVGKK